jgi:outer membrane lipoprotein carrier protein
MRKFFLWAGAILILHGLSSAPVIFGMSGTAVLAEIQNRYETTADFEAQFVQEYVGKVMQRPQKGEGQVYFKKKGMMRWDYQTPNQKLISNGQTLWYYQPEENQVFVSQLSRIIKERTPLAFLAGEGNLSQEFNLVQWNEAVSQKEENYVVELAPKEPNPALAKLILTVDRKTFTVTQTDVIDGLGNVTRTRFMNIKTNVSHPDSFFNFTIPPGTDVLRSETPASSPSGK